MPDASSQCRGDIDTTRAVGDGITAARLRTTTVSTYAVSRCPHGPTYRSSPDRKPLPAVDIGRTTQTARLCSRPPQLHMLVTDGGPPCHVRRTRSATPDRRWM